MEGLMTAIYNKIMREWNRRNDPCLDPQSLTFFTRYTLPTIKDSLSQSRSYSSEDQDSGGPRSAGSGRRSKKHMDDNEGLGTGIVVFTLWYLGIAYNYYMGDFPEGGGKSGCSESCAVSVDGEPRQPPQTARVVEPVPAPEPVHVPEPELFVEPVEVGGGDEGDDDV